MTDDDSRAYALQRIEHRLAVACGQQPGIEAATVRSVAAYINEIAIYSPLAWGHELRSKYTGQQDRSLYINSEDLRRAIWDDFIRRRDEGLDYYDWWAKKKPSPSDLELTAKQIMLFIDYQPLVRELATEVARGSNLVLVSELEGLGLIQLRALAREYHHSQKVGFEAYAKHRLRDTKLDYIRLDAPNWALAIGGKEPSKPSLTAEQGKLVAEHVGFVVNQAGNIAKGDQGLFVELEQIGMRELEAKARTYDPTRNTSFATHAWKRVRGAMLNHAMLNRGKTLNVGGIGGIEAQRRRPQRWSPKWEWTKTKTQPKTNTRPPRKPLPSGDMSDIERLVEKLPHRMRVVYMGRVLRDPPMTRAELARELGIPLDQISQINRIEKQAHQRLAKLLKPKKV